MVNNVNSCPAMQFGMHSSLCPPRMLPFDKLRAGSENLTMTPLLDLLNMLREPRHDKRTPIYRATLPLLYTAGVCPVFDLKIRLKAASD